MAGVVYLALFLSGGLLIARNWLPRLRPVVRCYIGVSLGVFLFLWLPALWAYQMTFSVTAHLVATLTLAVAVLFSFLSRDHSPRVRYGEEDRRMLRAVLWVSVPLAVAAAWLMYTHNIRPAADGAYHVGQSTYGDLSLHLAVATSAVNAKFPLHNSLMVGATMAYPYLADTFATSLYMLGMSLPAAMTFTGTLMCLMVIFGFALLTAQLARRRGTVALATCLLFLNGGLGFFFTLSGTVENGVVTTVWDNLRNVMQGYYQTPTNQPDPNNLRWVNVICDMLVPQRGILGGWTMLMPVLNLLLPPLATRRSHATRALLLAGILAGGMPLLHTHTYLALVLLSLGMAVYATLTAPPKRKMEAFRPFLLYACVAAALSMPQLVSFTFVQAAASEHFLRLQFNWANNRGGRGLVDGYFWFYIKNIGLPYLLILLALLKSRKGDLREEAELAAAQTDGLHRIEEDMTGTLVAAMTPPAPETPPVREPEPITPLEAPEPETIDEPELDERHSVIAHDMPAYGQHSLPISPKEITRRQVQEPFTPPLTPNLLRASAFSPEDNDRVGVMRAVTGHDKPEKSQRPLIEELFHHAFDAQKDAEKDRKRKAASMTDGLPETCFADAPIPRDWIFQHRLIAAGAFLILLIAEFILFQPNEYDNNKLIYVWFLLLLPMAADYALDLLARIKGAAGWRTLGALFLAACFLSSGLTLAREAISDYQAYTGRDIAVADFVLENTPEHSVFLTGTQHLNPVASLAGRTIVCGSDLYLYYHGFSTTARKQELRAFYEAPKENLAVLASYGVAYVYVSPWEWSAYAVDVQSLRELLTPIYESEDGVYLIFAVPEAYQGTAAANDSAAPSATADPALNPAAGG